MTETLLRIVKEWDVVKVRISDEVQKRIETLLAQNRCTACEEKHQPDGEVKCGACGTCYQAARRAIKAGKVTRAELVRQGKLLNTPTGRKPINKFTRELAGG